MSSLNNLALLLTSLERYEKAQELFDELFAIYGDRPIPPVLRKNQALLLAAAGEHAACEELTWEVLPLLRREDRIAEAKSSRGACLAGLGKSDEAEALLSEGYETLRRELGENDRRTRQARERLAAFHASQSAPSPRQGPG